MAQQDGVFPATRIYVATSWRNELQPEVVRRLRAAGYVAYDFRNPAEDQKGFAWSDIPLHGGENHDSVDAAKYVEILEDPIADVGFANDYNAMEAADIFVMVLPCERDAHLELGWACGAGKETHILLDDPCKASLMYKMADHIHTNLDGLLATLGQAD